MKAQVQGFRENESRRSRSSEWDHPATRSGGSFSRKHHRRSCKNGDAVVSFSREMKRFSWKDSAVRPDAINYKFGLRCCGSVVLRNGYDERV